MKEHRKISVGETALLAFLALCAVTLCSRSSPLYPMNDWVDPNCFFSVGKALAHGQVLYRDIFEQKGPYLYFSHILPYLVCRTGFFGVYLLEASAGFFFLFLSWRTVLLFTERPAICLFPGMTLPLYTASSFGAGDSAEELLLPFLSLALYLCLRSLREERALTARECLIIGLTAAAALWTKYTFLGFYAGCALSLLILYVGERRFREVGRALLWAGLGLVLGSVPVVIYCAVTGSFADLYQAYFYDNLFHYQLQGDASLGANLGKNLSRGLRSLLYRNTFSLFSLALGAGWFLFRKPKGICLVLFCAALGLLTTVYMGGRRYQYYCYIFSVFAPMGLVPAAKLGGWLLKKLRNWQRPERLARAAAWALAAAVIPLLVLWCGSRYLLLYPKEQMPQFAFAQIMNEKENATMLHYRVLDGGFYTASGIVPNCKYFCGLNVLLDEIDAEQDRYLTEGLVDFVVTEDMELPFPRYRQVSSFDTGFPNSTHTYRLYQKIA